MLEPKFISDLEKELEPVRSRLLEQLELRLLGPVVPPDKARKRRKKVKDPRYSINATGIYVYGVNSHPDLTGVPKVKRIFEIECQILLSWLLGESGYFIREKLEKKYRNSNLYTVRLCLTSKEICVGHFLDRYSPREWFGNILKTIRWQSRSLGVVTVEPKKPRKQQRQRGYRDHGNLVPDTQWKPKTDWTLIQLQDEIDYRRQCDESLIQFMEGMVT